MCPVVSASRVLLRSYARLQDLCPAWSRDAPLRHPRLWPATSASPPTRETAPGRSAGRPGRRPGPFTFAGLVLVLGPAALPASARSLLPGWAAPAEPKATAQQFLVSSNPAGAAVLIGGRELGRTPATVSTFPGLILTLRRAGFLDAFVDVGAPSADVTLWRAEPEVRLVRPPLPGASIASADFLPDGPGCAWH